MQLKIKQIVEACARGSYLGSLSWILAVKNCSYHWGELWKDSGRLADRHNSCQHPAARRAAPVNAHKWNSAAVWAKANQTQVWAGVKRFIWQPGSGCKPSPGQGLVLCYSPAGVVTVVLGRKSCLWEAKRANSGLHGCYLSIFTSTRGFVLQPYPSYTYFSINRDQSLFCKQPQASLYYTASIKSMRLWAGETEAQAMHFPKPIFSKLCCAHPMEGAHSWQRGCSYTVLSLHQGPQGQEMSYRERTRALATGLEHGWMGTCPKENVKLTRPARLRDSLGPLLGKDVKLGTVVRKRCFYLAVQNGWKWE